MFSRKSEEELLDREIDRAIREMRNHPVGSEEYVRTLNAVVRLYEMRGKEKPRSVSRDTLVGVIANLLGIIMIIKHEHVNVITSRAMNLIRITR